MVKPTDWYSGYTNKTQPRIYLEKKVISASVVLVSIVGALIICLFSSCQMTPARAEEITLKASWYSRASLVKEGTWKDGKEMRMANGEVFMDNNLTCATRLFPLGSLLRITNLENQKSVEVKVTDRIGKRFATKRIDLSKLAFSKLDKLEKGIIPIKVERYND